MITFPRHENPMRQERRRRRSRALAVLVALAAVSTPLLSQASTEELPLRKVHAARRVGPVHLDGVLTDRSWIPAELNTGFWQRAPNEGARVTYDTEFRVLYDREALYVGIRALDSSPDDIVGRMTRRDKDSASDWLVVGVDSYGDDRTAFLFAVNAAGVQRDVMIYDQNQEDPTWDAVWESAVSIERTGWNAEIRIPFSAFRFSSTQYPWGLQVMRFVPRLVEESYWSPTSREQEQIVRQFGELHGLEDIAPEPAVQLLPYVASGASVGETVGPASVFPKLEATAGMDLQYGLRNGLILSVAINPDFGQIEADPSLVNLSTREPFLPEKRPFFVEGSEIFRFSLGGSSSPEELFYSRRIGSRGRSDSDSSGIEAPRILGAAKLSGKTKGGWSVGGLTAVTLSSELGEETASGPEEGESLVTKMTALRMRKDLNDGRTVLGMAGNSVLRELGSVTMSTRHKAAFSGGLDMQHRFQRGDTKAQARVFGSHVRGSSEAIGFTQRSSPHFLQRPDASHVDYDPTRTALSGAGAYFELSRDGGEHWLYDAGAEARTPGLDVNALGFQNFADYTHLWATGVYRVQAPSTFRSWSARSQGWARTTFGGELVAHGASLGANVQLRSHWNLLTTLHATRNVLNPTVLRGGPALRGDAEVGGTHRVTTDFRKSAYASVFADWSRGSKSHLTVGTDLTAKPLSNFSLRVVPEASLRRNESQYIATVGEDSPRYIVGRIKQTTTSLTVTMDYTLTTSLSFELYAQPFISAASYDDFKEVDDPTARLRTDRFRDLSENEVRLLEQEGFVRPDFSIRELNATAVVRWEYRPGSTIFAIWNHTRNGFDAHSAPLESNIEALVGDPGVHTVLLKATYWWAL